MRHIFARLAVALLAACLLYGCEGAKPFNAVDITGAAGYGSDFRMTDHAGKTRTMADFRGKAVALFFGYTHCPDVCPTTLSDMRKVMELLGKDAEKFQVLFVTVDPKRDTQDLLAKYVPSFNPAFLGLYGDDAATSKMTRDFHIYVRQQPGNAPDSYSVDHTAGTLIFDAGGRLRLFVNYGMEAEKIAADVKRLI
jgi:protein SCO1/2